MDKKIFRLPALSAAALLAAVAAAPLQAATVSRDFAGNDCSGFFGQGFDACTIFINEAGERIEISPVIAKYEVDDLGAVTTIELNESLYPSIDGSEFTISYDTDTSSGSWTYDGTAPDPFVRYWATKAGNAFTMFWTVADSAVATGGVCDVADVYTLDCLNQALTVNSGDWSTPGGRALSHITFYDSEDPVVVPVPAAAWLFGSGLLGLVGIARRRRS